METLAALLEEEIAKREEIFENRTEKWQDSERGEAYQEKTDRLQEMFDGVMEWTEELGQ